MRVLIRRDVSGVSEIVGTILILMITVVLFSVIILWVGNFPTPTAQNRLDVLAQMEPIYNGFGVEIGVNITLVHRGGEALTPGPTLIYVTSQRGAGPRQTDFVVLHRWNGFLATPSGLLDGSDSVWEIGERWAYKNFALLTSDTIHIAIVDTLKSTVLWDGSMNAVQGSRPPVFVDKWADGVPATDLVDPVQANSGFYLYARVASRMRSRWTESSRSAAAYARTGRSRPSPGPAPSFS